VVSLNFLDRDTRSQIQANPITLASPQLLLTLTVIGPWRLIGCIITMAIIVVRDIALLEVVTSVPPGELS
jgi:hypothetical protein